MLKSVRREKGQGVSAEYVVMIVLVSVAIMGMMTFVRRALQGRYRDANIETVIQAASILNQDVQVEYEPYYVETTADVDSEMSAELTTVTSKVQDRVQTLQRKVNSVSVQKPF
jgi:Flp pilus assembly pilin Flp